MKLALNILVPAWLLAICFFVVFEWEIAETLWLLAPLVRGGLIGVGLVIMLLAALTFRRNRRIAAIACVIMATGLMAFFTLGPELGARVRFALVRSEYERRVAEILRAHDIAATPQSDDCRIDVGPPVRIAFKRGGGLVDNWTAIVYDPSGEVLKARQFKADWSNWDDPALRGVKHLFGGDLRWAEPLGGNWYQCSFT